MSIIESRLRLRWHVHAFLILFHIGAHYASISALKHAHLRLLFESARWTVLIAQQLLLLEGHSLHVLAISLKTTIKIIGFSICFSEFLYHVEIFKVVVRCHLQILIFHLFSLLSHDACVVGVQMILFFPFGAGNLQPL